MKVRLKESGYTFSESIEDLIVNVSNEKVHKNYICVSSLEIINKLTYKYYFFDINRQSYLFREINSISEKEDWAFSSEYYEIIEK